MPLTPSEQLITLSYLLAARREFILAAWRKLDRADPEQQTGRALTLGQFLDHIPPILDAYELKLRSRPGGVVARTADAEKEEEGVKHGLHRWQQGYRLKELISECGHFHICVFEELGNIFTSHPELAPETLLEAHRQLLLLINDIISGSAAQYERMQQAEAGGRVRDLMRALADVGEIEQRRATLIHQAVHDLTSDVLGVSLAATQISRSGIAETDRVESAALLQRAVQGLNSMLGELMDLARLEAGQENRVIAGFDAGSLITDLCDSNQPFAHERNLFLKTTGPAQLPVEGDAEKMRRVAKNLLVNALKYTESGGVIVSWGEEKENWWLMVKDTGPGMLTEAGTSMADGLQEATASAKESDEKSAAVQGETSHVLPPKATATPTRPSQHQPGEGIGLSIVKTLVRAAGCQPGNCQFGGNGHDFSRRFPAPLSQPFLTLHRPAGIARRAT